jgi:hypothetical protein
MLTGQKFPTRPNVGIVAIVGFVGMFSLVGISGLVGMFGLVGSFVYFGISRLVAMCLPR